MIISAVQAREVADWSDIVSFLKSYEQKIIEASEKGLYNCVIEDGIDYRTIDTLNLLGYALDFSEDSDTTFPDIISWSSKSPWI